MGGGSALSTCPRTTARRSAHRPISPIKSCGLDLTSLLFTSLASRTRRAGANIRLSVYVDSLRISRLVPTPQTPEAGSINLR